MLQKFALNVMGLDVFYGNESLHCTAIKVSYFARRRRAAETAGVKHADVLQSDMTETGLEGKREKAE